MNVAGPSRAPPPARRLAPGERVQSAYEEDLLGFLDQLSLDEMDEIQTFFAHRTSVGNRVSDHDVAMNDLLQQARALALFNEDRALAQRIAAGEDVGVNQGPVQAPRVAPPRPTNNRAATQRNGNQQRGAQAVRNNNAPSQSWGWLGSMIGWVFGSQPVLQPGPRDTAAPAPRTPAVRTPAVNRPTGHDCVICQDPIRGAEVRAPCGHYYDIDCVTDLFQSATRDETLYPPRCCRQNIPFAQVQPHLSQALVATFQSKQTEFSTLKRVYCSSPKCSRFLGPLSEGIFTNKVYTCAAPGCGRRTCGKCRAQHSGDWTHACRPDADAAEVLALGRTSGWARCPGCSQMIELHIGCFHMTCRCRTEFCYLCRARWKTCRCPQWDERRLLVVAEERVDAQLGAAPERGAGRNVPPRPPRPVPVRAAAPAPAPAPAPVPPHHPRAPADNTLVNRARAAMQVAAAAPVPARPPTIQLARPQPTPARTPTVGASSSASSASPASSTRQAARITAAPASTPASSSGAGKAWRPQQSGEDIDGMRQRLVREMMERLREDHECDHSRRWRYRDGGGICQSCGHYLPLYLFRCQGCEMLACNRCRRNRL